MDGLIGTPNGFLYLYPALLNIEYADSPVVESIKIYIKDKEFRWEHAEINREFIPLMVLRNMMDVSRPRLAIFKENQLQVLYDYLSDRELVFKRLFNTIFET